MGFYEDWVNVTRKLRGKIMMIDIGDEAILDVSDMNVNINIRMPKDTHAGTMFNESAEGFKHEYIKNSNLQSSSVNLWLEIIMGQLYVNNVHYLIECLGIENSQ